ncbi:MAG TPA: DNA polymerase III subunit alpha, partial [Agitococcus sp.]|nr:DNA polymerase III subunit alpha [Agitococcus sp.]
DDFCNRKHGRAKVAYPDETYQHDCLEPILKPTYGVIVYQEQVMQIAQEMAGYSLGGADMLRRAMGKKKPEEMAKERVKFMAGATGKGIDADLAGHIFDLMEKFAGYGFNKSHSAAYALVSYQTAWLKQHYPAEFMAAVLSAEMHNTDNVVTFIEECRTMGLPIVSPDVNHSNYKFVPLNETIVYGLGAIKGVGEGPIESIIAARKEGDFKDLFDFCRRIDLRKANKRTLEALIKAGAMDNMSGVHRASIMATLSEAVKAAEQQNRNQNAGMMDLFGEVVEATPNNQYLSALVWTDDERLQGEKDTLGLYLTGHPIDQYYDELKRHVACKLCDLQPTRRGQSITITGLIMDVRIFKGPRGTRAILLLDDRSGRVEASVFGELYEQVKQLLVVDNVIILDAEVSPDEFKGGLRVTGKKVYSLLDARLNSIRSLELALAINNLSGAAVQELKQLLLRFLPNGEQKGINLSLRCQHSSATAVLQCGSNWRIYPHDDLLKRLKQVYGTQAVRLVY